MEKWNNSMYDFKDTIISRDISKQFLPTSAMMYDGIFFEEIIDGYQTLSVEGREMLSTNIEYQAVQKGAIVTGQTLPVRTLKVTYKLEDQNPERLQFKFKTLLNHLYRSEDVEIRFRDEADYYYYGRYSTADNVPGNTNSIISSFTIFCADPLKYTREIQTDGYIGNKIIYPVTPSKIEVLLTRNNSIRITNGKYVISVSNAAIKTGDVLIFDFFNEQLLVNDKDYTSVIDLESDFENFHIEQGQTIKSDNGRIKIYYRGATI